MPANNDPQREDEISRQRGYGESAKSDGKRAKNQDTRTAGFARDDENADDAADPQTVKTMEDEAHPTVPDHANSDSGELKHPGRGDA